MAKKKDDLTPYALEGFTAAAGAKCPHLATSPAALAWHVGAWLQRSGRSAPRDVSMSRGYTVRANDMLLDAANAPAIERIS